MNTSPNAKSRWSRMGGAVRRASSVLITTRPSTPSIASSDREDATSIKGINTSSAILTPPPSQHGSAPSPISESPARERAATEEDAAPIGPSPLAQGAVTAPQEAPPSSEALQTSPQEYTPPPLLDSSATGPGAFTDEPDELPQPQVITDPALAQPESDSSHEPTTQTVAEPEPQVSSDEPAPESVPSPVSESAPEVSLEPSTPEPITPPPGLGAPKSYFDIPVQDEPLEDLELSSRPTEDFKKSVDSDLFSAPATDTTVRPGGPPAIVEPAPSMPTPAPEIAILPPSTTVESAPSMPAPAPAPAVLPPSAPVYAMPSFEFNPGQEVWGGPAHKPEEDPTANEYTSTRSRSSSIRMPLEDPFADPIAPRLPPSQPRPQVSEQHQPEPTESHDEAHGAIIMPLPPIHDVIPSKSIRDAASTHSLKGNGGGNFETDETRPLLSRVNSPKYTSYLLPDTTTPNVVAVSPQSGTSAAAPWPLHRSAHGPRLHELGWIEYQLPDSTVYYVHPTRRVTTDIDLRDEKKLTAVTTYFEHHKDAGATPAGIELWLRDAEIGKRGSFVPARFWVDHKQRMVSLDRSPQNGDAARAKKVQEDDQLDIEYRYWSFMEAHPAHMALPSNARIEATDVLTWAWTDRLLPSHRSVPAPFTQEECQELMSLLRSFGDQNDSGLQTVVHTRIVSRILLRVAHWRQQHFRSNKPLPKDVTVNDLHFPKHRKPFRRALFDFVISCLCLGIPYIFFRTRNHRLDEESGLRSPAPMLVVGACTCLIAAIVLSASVTFLSLPGLDNIARLAGFVAILFSTFSMASTLVALFRFKADLESPVSHVGGEGLMMLSRRSVVMALPLVFLVYAIAGFVTGIILYSFRGVTITDPLAYEHPFENYTRWTVVGVFGGLAGMLTTSLLLLRR